MRIEYRCADGTPFPVTFVDAEQAATTWRLDREHTPDPQSPLAAALGRLGRGGTERAYADAGLPVPFPFRLSGPTANGFAYYSEASMTADDLTELVSGCAKLVEVHGSAQGIWHDYALPRTKDCCRFLEQAEPGAADLRELAEAQAYGQQMTMIPAFVGGRDLMMLAATCAEIVGPERSELVAYELTQGYDNETLAADQALWEVARNPSAERVDAFLAEFGHRAEAWDIAAPTWNERGPGFHRQLEAMAAPATPEPRAAVVHAAQRRQALVEELDAKMEADGVEPDKRARLHRRIDRVATYVAVREERARWQLALVGALRHAVLRAGRDLVQRGVIDEAGDVLYLLPEEIEGEGGHEDRRADVAARRAEHARWKAVWPPEVVGGEHRPDGRPAQAPVLPDDGIVKGIAASRGSATGTAKVIVDLADADRFEPGDVLVCVTTTPPWTPLFGLAAAIVVDSGDIASHSGVAAREYGIPCVLATKVGTVAIPDGATVTVDGDAGTVEVVRR